MVSVRSLDLAFVARLAMSSFLPKRLKRVVGSRCLQSGPPADRLGSPRLKVEHKKSISM